MNTDTEDDETPIEVEAEAEAVAVARCEVTGKIVPAEDVVEFRGRMVSAEGKERLLRELRNADDPVPGENELVRPGFWRRLLCSLLDGFITTAILVVLAVVMIAMGPRRRFDPNMRLYFLLIGGTAAFLYYGLMHGKYGQTLGKMAGGYRVVNLDGSPISMHTAFMRVFWSTGLSSLVGIIGALTGSAKIFDMLTSIYFLTNSIFLLSDRETARAFHDRLVGTRVVMDEGRR